MEIETLEQELKRLFEPIGTIRRLAVKRSKDNRYSFAFLEYETEEQAEQAIKELDQIEVHGKKLKVYKER